MGLVRQLSRQLLTACLPATAWLVRGVPRAGAPAAISLTFDDGPHPLYTPLVLEALARWNVRGTFFIVGELAVQYPELVRRIVEEGHSLGNHTWTHSEPSRTSMTQFLEEVNKTHQWLREQGFPVSRWVRPPKGELTCGKLHGLIKAGYGIALWNIDPKDYRMTSLDDLARYCRSYQPSTGDIILLHDRLHWAAAFVNSLGEHGHFDRFAGLSLDAWLPTSASSAQAISSRSMASVSSSSALRGEL